MPALQKNKNPPKMTFDEFISWREDKEGRWELHDGVPVRKHDPLKGHSERARHFMLKGEVYALLREEIKKTKLDCIAVVDGATIRIDELISYEPDALVYCGDPIGDDDLIVPEPVIIVEVLSPSTAYKDVSTKLADYFKLPSVMHYLILDPQLKRVQHHYRADNAIRLDPVEGGTLYLDPPGIVLKTDELFA